MAASAVLRWQSYRVIITMTSPKYLMENFTPSTKSSHWTPLHHLAASCALWANVSNPCCYLQVRTGARLAAPAATTSLLNFSYILGHQRVSQSRSHSKIIINTACDALGGRLLPKIWSLLLWNARITGSWRDWPHRHQSALIQSWNHVVLNPLLHLF